MKFNLMMHNALMVERTMLGVEDYEVPANLEELTINQKPFFQNAKNIFYTLEQFYRIEISNWELYVIYEIFVFSVRRGWERAWTVSYFDLWPKLFLLKDLNRCPFYFSSLTANHRFKLSPFVEITSLYQ